jgi:GDP-L-fucose synthase
MTGALEPTNRPYAIAKIAGIEMCSSYNRQYGTKFLAAMPTNLYGANDNYDPKNSHVVASLIRKFHAAKTGDSPDVVIWGTGNPRREFLFSNDAADACIFLMNLPEAEFSRLSASKNRVPAVNIGCGEDLSIRELAELVGEVVGRRGNITFDPEQPDGTPRKLLDVSILKGLGWTPTTPLRSGLAVAYNEYLQLLKGPHLSSPHQLAAR